MENPGEQPKFEIQSVIEQRPFENPAVQSFFTEWCKINDTIEPQMIGRGDWKRRGMKGILEKRPNGKQTLYIPKDLQLWEMVDVMEAVDHDTFASKPERQDEAKKKLLELGKTFENAGIYIVQRLGSIDQGKNIARALAERFYGYGQSLTSGKKSEKHQTIHNIASHALTTEELDAVDRFLAGDNLYQSRQARVKEALRRSSKQTSAGNPSQKNAFNESERQKTLSQFFRVSEKAFELSKPKYESFSAQTTSLFSKRVGTITGGELKKQQRVERSKSEAWLKYQKFLGENNLSPKEQRERKQLEQIIFTKKPWRLSSPAHLAFLAKIKKATVREIETPKRELVRSIFRRGMKLLQENMPFGKLPNSIKETSLHWQSGEKTLRETLQIDKLRQELDSCRKGEISDVQFSISFAQHCNDLAQRYGSVNNQFCRDIRNIGFDYNARTGYNLDPSKKIKRLVELGQLPQEEIDKLKERYSPLRLINDKEREITDKIQGTVGSFLYQRDANNPSEIVANQYINCVGASTLGGALMREAGLHYLVGCVPRHSILFLVTEDGHVEWRDMLNSSFNENLTDEMIEGRKKNGLPLTVADIVAFSRNPMPEGLMFNIKGEGYRDKLPWIKEGQRQFVAVFEPEYGQQIQVLYNTCDVLFKLGRKKEALEAYRQAIAVDPKFVYSYYGFGYVLFKLGRKKEALEAYRQAIAVDPKYARPYYGLGYVLSKFGRNEEEIEAYQKFIDLADKEKDDYWIKRAERIIAKLQSK